MCLLIHAVIKVVMHLSKRAFLIIQQNLLKLKHLIHAESRTCNNRIAAVKNFITAIISESKQLWKIILWNLKFGHQCRLAKHCQFGSDYYILSHILKVEFIKKNTQDVIYT